MKGRDYLGGHAAPEVGVRRSGLHHGRHDGLVLRHQLPQHIPVGEQVVAVDHLRRDGEEEEAVVHKQAAASITDLSSEPRGLITPQRYGHAHSIHQEAAFCSDVIKANVSCPQDNFHLCLGLI